MPRRPPSDLLLARVRAWFGLTQAELALYLGISPPLVRDLETGRRPLTPDVRVALLPLLLQLPPPEVPVAPGRFAYFAQYARGPRAGRGPGPGRRRHRPGPRPGPRPLATGLANT